MTLKVKLWNSLMKGEDLDIDCKNTKHYEILAELLVFIKIKIEKSENYCEKMYTYLLKNNIDYKQKLDDYLNVEDSKFPIPNSVIESSMVSFVLIDHIYEDYETIYDKEDLNKIHEMLLYTRPWLYKYVIPILCSRTKLSIKTLRYFFEWNDYYPLENCDQNEYTIIMIKMHYIEEWRKYVIDRNKKRYRCRLELIRWRKCARLSRGYKGM
jgi:hypothetical protein